MSQSDPLHEQLIHQARYLAKREPKHPQQASLRRAISAAYYALFHYLIDEATRAILGASDAGRPSREAIARGFEHGKMAEASKIFQGDSLSDRFRLGPIPADLRKVASAFVQLQGQRHKADYDLSATFSAEECRKRHSQSQWGDEGLARDP